MSGRFIPRAASPFMGRMSLGCCSSSGPAPSASAALFAIRLWDPRVPTHPSLSSLSDSCWTSSANRNPRGRRPRADTAHCERSALWAPTRSLGPRKEYLLGLSEPPAGPPPSEGPVQNVGILSIPATPVLLSTHNNSPEGDPPKAAFRGSARSNGLMLPHDWFHLSGARSLSGWSAIS